MDTNQTAAVGVGGVALSAGAYSIGVHGWLEWLIILGIVFLILKIVGVSFTGIWGFLFKSKEEKPANKPQPKPQPRHEEEE